MNLKRTALIFLMGMSGLPGAFGAYAHDNSLLARVTVYWARGGHGSDRYTRQHKSASGLALRQGHCAVDPRKIPYGSKVVLPDGTALSAVDTGTAVRNRKAARRSARTADEHNAIVIDKFFENKRQALMWANSNPQFVNVKVIPPNAPALAKPNLTTPQPIALTQPQPAQKPAGDGSAAAVTIINNAPAGGVVRNPLGRLGR